ncbi:MAG: hypothetical protein ACM3YO_05865 [Bacteroidota bacterium]
MKRTVVGVLLTLAFAGAPAWAEETLEVSLPHPASAFFLSLTPPGGGHFFLGDPLKGSLYLGGSLAGGVLGYLAFDWIPPGRSPIANDAENIKAALYGVAGFLAVGLLSGIDASLTAQSKHTALESMLEGKEAK